MGKLLKLRGQVLLNAAKVLAAGGYTPVELREAIPYIREFQHRIMVVKVGGSVLEKEPAPQRTFFEDVAFMAHLGLRMILVHGGSRQLSERMRAEHIEPTIEDGERHTDRRTLRLAIEEFNKLNKEVVACIKAAGGKAVPFPAGRNDIVEAERKGSDPKNFVGRVTRINADRLRAVKDECIPVITCIGGNGELFNINADDVAAAIAKELKAEKLILLTDVEGVKDSCGDLISTLTVTRATRLLASRVISKGMVPKVKVCIDALKAGVSKAHIINGNAKGSLLCEVLTDGGVGTEIVMHKPDRVHRHSA